MWHLGARAVLHETSGHEVHISCVSSDTLARGVSAVIPAPTRDTEGTQRTERPWPWPRAGKAAAEDAVRGLESGQETVLQLGGARARGVRSWLSDS